MSEKQEHIEQLAIGGVTIGNGGITKKHKDQGYVCHLCTMNKEGRFVDIALTQKHLLDLKEIIDHWINVKEAMQQ